MPASGVMLESLSGVQLPTCSGYDWVSHIAMPNQIAGVSWKSHDRPRTTAGGGSFGSVSCHRLRLPAPAVWE
jgi:hypothetical protein